MKKKILSSLIALSAAALLCGFDSAETADSVCKKMTEAQNNIQGMSAEISFNLDGAASISDGQNTTPITASAKGAFDTDYTLNPFAMAMEGSMSYGLSLFGTEETITEKAYIVTADDGSTKTYVYTENSTSGDSGWMVQPLDGLNMTDLIARGQSTGLDKLNEWGITFTLAPEAADVNGTECYLLSTKMDSESFGTILTKATEMLGDKAPAAGELSEVLALMGGLQLNIEYYIDCATYLPVKTHMDMNDSDLTIINMLLSSYLGSLASQDAAPSTVELTLNDASIDVISTFGDIAPITVPDEAIAAELSGNTLQVNDIVSTIQ